MKPKLKIALIYVVLTPVAIVAFIWAFVREQKETFHMAWLNSFAEMNADIKKIKKRDLS